jgi:tRNA-2-methylthio-N6-dimethylallyladenosine synthase
MSSQASTKDLVQLGKRPSTGAVLTASGDGPRVYLETYGCQMNVADSNLLSSLLAEKGYRKAEGPDDADVLVINTCAIRERAEERVYARARELGSHKIRKKGSVLAITGCMAEHLKESILERLPQVDIIAGPDSYRRFESLVSQARTGAQQPFIDVKLDREETYEGIESAAGGDGVSAFVSIQRGCDKFCTFCVVPYTRGRERGLAPREILRHVRGLAESGVREVVLLGQTVNSYRFEDVRFSDLLRSVASVDGIERVRFTSPYPVDFSADVIEAMAAEPRICNFVHLPLQSGANSVLERMRRGYSVEDFLALVEALRAAIPDMALSTDILTGFCGETDADHRATLDVMRQVRFDSAFMFAYSERERTYASRKIPDDVPEEIKKARLSEIISLQEGISSEINQAQIGKVERVLLHSRSKRDAGQLVGRTDGFKSVIIDAGDRQPGDFVSVQIERATMATLFGREVAR